MKAENGYMGKILFVDLSHGQIYEENLSETVAKRFIGGYGIGAKVLCERMQPGMDPLGPSNILGFGTGPFTGTGTICTSRFTVMGKSPLTGLWGDANCGGSFANAIKSAGYDFVFIMGKAEKHVYLLVTDEKVEVKDAFQIWGRDSVETERIIREETGDARLRIACIGPAGENCSLISAVINDAGRAAARSGLGAVMGSKNLKAIASRGSKKPKAANPTLLINLMKDLGNQVKNNPSFFVQMLRKFGTSGAMGMALETQDAPIKNWAGTTVEDFPLESKGSQIDGEAIMKYVTGKYACSGCPIGCGAWVRVEGGKWPISKDHRPEYETLAAFGPLCLNHNLESIMVANELCNRNGLDTMSAGATIAFAIECFENGILTKEDTDGLELTWGNADVIVQVLDKMCKREGVGEVLADGIRIAARKIGRGAERFAMEIGGQEVAMHDPRQDPGYGTTYLVDPTPARHTQGGTAYAGMEFLHQELKSLGFPPVIEKYKYENKGKAQAILASWRHLNNTTGLCMFALSALDYPMLKVMNAITGWDLNLEEFLKAGKRIATVRHVFNLREGFRPNDFTMPPRLTGKPPFKVGPLKGVTIDFEELKRQYYKEMGWDPEAGQILRKTIEELDLQEISSEKA